MDQSRRAVEAYWRSRMIDGVTAEEDKVAPVYKLEEICELLQTSPAAIVKEVSDYILKRLDHKSPLVKQKALRLIKYAVGKSGNEFRREMQRNSAAMRELTHYKGQLDPLKGDALNKAVRDTAHEAIAAVFSTDESKAVAPVQGLDKRIQGFGNTNFEVPTGDKKSFLSEVVSISSASIMQGLSTIAAAHSSRKNDTGTYKSPALRRSLTTEPDTHNEYVRNENHKESWEASGISRTSAMWGPDSRVSVTTSISNEDASSSSTVIKTREERLLDTIVTSGGVRLQPTRDALLAFLAETAKLDALAMSHAIETKLESHLWQVRMKAICVLESILKKNDDEHFIIIISYFTENKDSIIKCSELPQASLRDKAIKVLTLLDGEQSYSEKAESCDGKTMPAPVYQMPDLIDTGEFDDCRSQDSMEKQGEHTTEKLKPSGSLVDDLFGSDSLADLNPTINGNQDDPFADVSFHASGDKEQSNLFSGLTVDHNKSDTVLNASNTKKPDLFDVFGTNGEQPEDGEGKDKNNVHNLMSGLSLNGLTKVDELRAQGAASGGAFAGLSFSANSSQSSQIPTNGPSKANLDLTSVYSQAPTHFAIPPNMVLNPGFATQPMNYGAMSAFIAQQQYLMQNLGNLNSGFGYMAGNSAGGSNASPLPDIFQLSNNPLQSHPSITKNPKEDTKAFDFITDHLSAARGSKRVT